MRTRESSDDKLAAWLDDYKVADADVALLDLIMARAGRQNTLVVYWSVRAVHIKSLTLLALIAFAGFWLGSTTMSKTKVPNFSQSLSFQSISLEGLALGAKNFSEVML